MTVEIPEEAMPVIRILKRDVQKPAKSELHMLRIGRHNLPRLREDRCPLGLHSTAPNATPYRFRTGPLSRLKHERLDAFIKFWDGLTIREAREAVDLIWPQEAQQ